jgi:hypothetical protein
VTYALAVFVARARHASPRPGQAATAQLALGAIAIGSDNVGAGEATRTA